MNAVDQVEQPPDLLKDESDGANLLLPLVLRETKQPSGSSDASVIVGEIVAIAEDGRRPVVRFPGQTGPMWAAARCVVDITTAHIGRPVVLLMEEGDSAKPIIMGVLREGDGSAEAARMPIDIEVDGVRTVVSASQQLVLRCGKASITLTRAGKVLIQGEYVSTQSSGINRIKGGAVQIN